MKYSIVATTMFLIMVICCQAQQSIITEGGFTVGNLACNPEPGTIKWTGTDFVGWNGEFRVSLTGHATLGEVTDIDGIVIKRPGSVISNG